MVCGGTSNETRVHRLALIASCVLALSASAPVETQTKQGDATTAGRQPSFGMYVPPNEQHPAVALPIWKQSNHGAYVSVGTERSFMGAAVTQAEALVVIDYDAAIVEFAAINRALLAVSHGREDYITLRLTASPEVWAKRAAEVGLEDAKTLRDKNAFAFWRAKVRENTTAWSAAFEHFNKQASKPDGAFVQTNYMFDDQLYEHLHQLAQKGRIWMRTVDLRDEQAVRRLCEDIRAKGWRLGVVDTSNVQDVAEAGPAAAGQYVAWFSPFAEDDTLFLNTERANRQADTYWSYFAFRGKTVKGRDAKTIERWYKKEIAKLGSDEQTRADVDDREIVLR